MPEINIFVCDWCGEEYDDQELPPTAEGWTLNLDPETKIRASTSNRVESIYLFPKVMRNFPDDGDGEAKAHVECIFCPECITALQDAVKDVREIRISKHEAE